LSDGLTEEITTTLARIQGLKVAARNSAFCFKGKTADPQSIGNRLKVNTLLTGSVRKVGGRLRVSAQLVNAADGFQLWSETYERSVDDILAVQQEIARRIADRLQAGARLPSSAKAPGPQAHRTYLLARHYWNKRTESGLTNAIRVFNDAINLDPVYADAHSGLAASYLVLPNYAPVPRSQYLPLARAAAQRALDIDPDSAEAHCVFAQLDWAGHNLKAAEEHFTRALQVAPNYATAHHWYGLFLTAHRRGEAGLAELLAAVDLDPLSPIIRTSIPQWYYLNGNAERAIQEARSVIEVFPEFPVARVMLSYALVHSGRFAEALQVLEEARKIEPADPVAHLDVTAYILARSGQETPAREILAHYEQLRAAGKSVDGPLALIYTGLREFDQAVDALERLAATDVLEDTILCDPFYRDLAHAPRFEALVKNAKLYGNE
jgi:TolB-like protein/Flp pilus assembly protein TadD